MNVTDSVGNEEWVGRALERLRKLRGLRRQDVAAQMADPVSPSTIRNIEHDAGYNVSLMLLRQIAAVLGAELVVSVKPQDDGPQSASEQGAEAMPRTELDRGELKVLDNEYFIRRIRERYPACPLTNSQIGRRMWALAETRGAARVRERKQLRKVEPALQPRGHRLPTTAAEYSVSPREIEALERFADRLGRAYKDAKGRILVPFA